MKTIVTVTKGNQTTRSPSSEMLFQGRKTFFLLKFYFILSCLEFVQNGETARIPQTAPTKVDLAEKILKMLDKLEQSPGLDINVKFTLLLGEFLIKQKVRFYEPTRYEEQLYFHIMQKLNLILQKPDSLELQKTHKQILENVFQRDVLLIPPVLKERHIDKHLEYNSLSHDYDQLVGTGIPNSTLSDLCLAAIVTLDKCNLRDDCMQAITSDLPTFGYHRMHQILLLYVFMHHTCSRSFGSEAAYEILSSEKCTQAYREQNVIRDSKIPVRFRDLYLEQNVICGGLFGYTEFLNWSNMAVMMSWPNEDGCYCMQQELQCNSSCSCNNHLNSLALVYYINALLLLE